MEGQNRQETWALGTQCSYQAAASPGWKSKPRPAFAASDPDFVTLGATEKDQAISKDKMVLSPKVR